MEYQNINFDNSNSENGCNQQMPCPLENLNNLPLSISDENLPCIDGCSNENNLQINNYPCNTFPSLNYDLSSPLPFNIQLTELPIAAPQDLFNQQNDYDNLENNEILISSLTTLIPSSSPLPTSSSFSISSPVEVSPSIEEEQFISTDIIEVITSTELNSQNIYEDNNNKLLDTTNKINIDSYLNNNENNEQKIEEIINEAVNKEKPKEKENKSEDEELKINNNNCEDFELKKIVEKALLSTKLNNLEAARNIESNSANKFGGRFNSIVSNNEFAYVNWYGKRNCQLKAGGRHSLTWED
ncbi:Ground-like domain-containing protein [Meloidogyne graminicola]|uniref:Ground-like domain-containing protein n=1 Tax=Meloidogyne graminicola TaxID=189291 RepID=A0A8S9ZKE4_9BILA|nr:Ground-like domain-containing protein [Meloidogyne graminicola]